MLQLSYREGYSQNHRVHTGRVDKGANAGEGLGSGCSHIHGSDSAVRRSGRGGRCRFGWSSDAVETQACVRNEIVISAE
jgi:hypothetical protein